MEIKFNRYPVVPINGKEALLFSGWDEIMKKIRDSVNQIQKNRIVIVIECYHGVFIQSLIQKFSIGLNADHVFLPEASMFSEAKIMEITFPDVTNDRVFGYLTRLNMVDLFDPAELKMQQEKVSEIRKGIVLIIGHGASLLTDTPDIIVYADMTRWEIQKRMKKNLVCNLGLSNRDELFETKYKRGFFVDWRICDRLKKSLINRIDFFLDTNSDTPKMISSHAFFSALKQVVSRPFSLLPYFDPGPWGGQWMKQELSLEPDVTNYAWCFNCVPEENSLCLAFGDSVYEMPAINLVFFQAVALLGDAVQSRFGEEFPIRFDYLDTMDGENLSLQVHPMTSYIQEQFGMHYTQDESYYLMAVKEGGCVYLGLKNDIDKNEMIQKLLNACDEGSLFNAEKYVATWPAKKHDHFSIPAGTIHCSGKNAMVLEISATPYIFTFKLWDWGRNGLDGRPRPTHIEHGLNNIQWDRNEHWTNDNLIGKIVMLDEGDGWIEEKTGLHEREFIETRRHWFTKKVAHHTKGGVNVLNLVEGDEVVVESPDGAFDPFMVGYAETFIVPAAVGAYTIRPSDRSKASQFVTIKAFVRTNA